MHKISVKNDNRILYAEDGELLGEVLIKNSLKLEHPCGGRGTCGKCTLKVNGKEELSCQYTVKSDIEVELSENEGIQTAFSGDEGGNATENMCLLFDVGTTTLVLALFSLDDGKIVRSITRNNPQRAFAADVMSRIDYAAKNGAEKLTEVIINELNSMIEELNCDNVPTLFVAGNTTMLHLLFGVNPSSMGQAPYTPVFIDKRECDAESLGIKGSCSVVALRGISAFVGADIVAGLNCVEADKERYNILVDLGTNAEVVLYSKNKLYCTAAAAGPCFEGVNISCGMSATKGAIYSCTENTFLTIGGGEAKGICATGLIDVIALMLEGEYMDETGFIEESFEITDNVKVTGEDVRQFQLAKSAICSAIYALVKKAATSFDCIDKVYVSGGFSSKMNVGNALRLGLLPMEAKGKIYPLDNSCLKGLCEYAQGRNSVEPLLVNAEYVDLAKDSYFGEQFIENMMF